MRFIIKTLLFNNDEEIRLGQGQTKIHGEVKKFQLPSENAVVLYVWYKEKRVNYHMIIIKNPQHTVSLELLLNFALDMYK